MAYEDRFGHINMNPAISGALWAAGQAPGLFGLPATLARFGMKAYNTGVSDDVRRGLGGPGLSVGQWLGGILGLNRYGDLNGNQTIYGRGQFANPYNNSRAAVTTGGLYDDGSLFGSMLAGLFGGYADPVTSYTPEEARMRQLMAGAYQRNPAAFAPRQAALPPGGVQGPMVPKAAWTPGDIAMDRNPALQSQTVNAAGAGPYGVARLSGSGGYGGIAGYGGPSMGGALASQRSGGMW